MSILGAAGEEAAKAAKSALGRLADNLDTIPRVDGDVAWIRQEIPNYLGQMRAHAVDRGADEKYLERMDREHALIQKLANEDEQPWAAEDYFSPSELHDDWYSRQVEDAAKRAGLDEMAGSELASWFAPFLHDKQVESVRKAAALGIPERTYINAHANSQARTSMYPDILRRPYPAEFLLDVMREGENQQLTPSQIETALSLLSDGGYDSIDSLLKTARLL